MTLDEYQAKAMTTAVYPRDIPWLYPILALTEEAGEVAGKLAKMVRKHGALSNLPPDVRDAVEKEMGDVLWDLAALAQECGLTLEGVATKNLAKLADRQARNKLVGEGDGR